MGNADFAEGGKGFSVSGVLEFVQAGNPGTFGVGKGENASSVRPSAHGSGGWRTGDARFARRTESGTVRGGYGGCLSESVASESF